MKKIILIISLIFFTYSYSSAQISTYHSYDNVCNVVYELEDMDSYEIKDYNRWMGEGCSHEYALVRINAARSQDNLISAPATLVDFHFSKEVTEQDSMPDALGAVNVWIELINTTPKTIKEITFKFEFENNYTKSYDIKTGDQFLILKFNNLTGRTKSDIYDDIVNNITKCYHLLTYKEATYKKLFYNKKVTNVILHSVNIKYTDGSSSSKISVFSHGYSGKDSFFRNGPLSPMVLYVESVKDILGVD